MDPERAAEYGLMGEAVTRATLPDEKLEELLLAAAEEVKGDDSLPLYDKIGHVARYAYRAGAAAALFCREDPGALAAMEEAFRQILDEAERFCTGQD